MHNAFRHFTTHRRMGEEQNLDAIFIKTVKMMTRNYGVEIG